MKPVRIFKYILAVFFCLGSGSVAFSQYYLKLKSDSIALESDSVKLTIDEHRGTINWQVSADIVNWTSLNKTTDTLGIRIDSSAYYRATIIDGTCNPIISDTVFLLEKLTKTESNQFTVDSLGGVFLLPSGIKVKIPRGAVNRPKKVKFDLISADSVNSLAAISLSENTTFLTGITITNDEMDFKKPIKVKIPVQGLDETGLAVLHKLNNESGKWYFSDETIIVSPENNFIEIIFSSTAPENTLLKGKSDINIIEAFFLEIFGDIFYSEDPCRKIGYEVVSESVDNAAGDGCDATMIYEDIVYFGCNPPQTGLIVGLALSSACEPLLKASPSELKIQKDKSGSIQLNTSVGGFPLSDQEIQISTSGNLYVSSSIVFSGSDGNKSISVKGLEVGEGNVYLSVSFDYHLTTIHASGNTGTENSEYDPVSIKKNYTIDVLVFDLPEVETVVSDIECETATIGGNVITDNYDEVTERGVLLNGAKLQAGSGIGKFSFDLSLEPGKTYSVKAFATNEAGTAYGEEVEFKPKCIPVVTTDFSTNYEDTRAFAGGEVTEDWELDVTERGVYLNFLKIPLGEGLGSFEAELFDLKPNKNYKLKAYATNLAGTGFGEEIGFVLDVDGNIYRVVTIGTQHWLSENLKTTRLNDGGSILYETDEWKWNHDSVSSPKYCWYDNSMSNKYIYGAIYNWEVVWTYKLCPIGWHIPSKDEYLTLVEYAGGVNVAGGKLKALGRWKYPNTGATDEFGLTALPGGYRTGYDWLFPENEEDFDGIGEVGVWLTSTTDVVEHDYYYVYLSYDNQVAGMSISPNLSWGACVRCIKSW